MKGLYLCHGFLSFFAGYASGSVLEVGPGRQYATPCRAIAAAATGDKIQIDGSAQYRGDVCGWNTNNLTIIGVNGRPKLDAMGQSFDGKATWVISGNNTTVDNIEFTGNAVPNHNGAAIRQHGANLTVRNCYIHDNEEGILAGDNRSSHILIENTEFARNGYEDGQAHNIYVNHVAMFTLRFSYSHDAISGHLVKSRALENFILYNRLTGESGTASYQVDLPNGGRSYVIGNILEKGLLSENPSVVGYGEEGPTNPNSNLYFVNNTVVNHRRSKGPAILVGHGAPTVFVQNNIFNGIEDVSSQPNARLLRNLLGGALFIDPANHDYHLQPDSPARDFGITPTAVEGYSLVPRYQYVHPTCYEMRRTTGRVIDVGAFEFHGGNGVDPSCSNTGSTITLLDISLSTSQLAGRDNTTGTVRLTGPAPPGGATIHLSSSDPQVAVPSNLMIAQGNASTVFKVSTKTVTAPTMATISAMYREVAKSVSFQIEATAPRLLSLDIPAKSVIGGRTIAARLTLANASSVKETTITLSTFPFDMATVPSQITVPAGSSTAEFNIKTVLVHTNTHVAVNATYDGVTKGVSLTLLPSGR